MRHLFDSQFKFSQLIYFCSILASITHLIKLNFQVIFSSFIFNYNDRNIKKISISINYIRLRYTFKILIIILKYQLI